MKPTTCGKEIGRLVGLWRYPVKSMGPESLEQVDVAWFGLTGDRRWAFVRDDANKSGFPWLTIRERPDMHRYQPSFVNPSQPDRSDTQVRTPLGEVLNIHDPALGSELYPSGVRLIKQDRGIFDTFPLSLITTQTIANLSEAAGTQLDVQRFRPNFLVETHDEDPFPEDGWVGSILRIGAFRFRVDKRDGRCSVINVDPITTEKNPHVLRTVTQQRGGCLGVYGSTVEPGTVALHDSIFLESPTNL